MDSSRLFLSKPLLSSHHSKFHSTIHSVPSLALQALNDQSLPQPSVSITSRVINFYSSRPELVLRPDSPILLLWHFIIMVIIGFYFIEIGLLIAFPNHFWHHDLHHLLPLQIAFIILLAIDILISPLKAYYDCGLLITNPRLIIKNYTKACIWIDLAGLIVIIIPLITGSLESNYCKALWFLKLYTASLINNEYQRLTQLHLTINTSYLILKIFVVFYWFSHFIGVGFYRVSLWVYQNNYYGPNTPTICWIYNAQAYSQMVILLPWTEQYTYIMYYSIALVSAIAYGDITPLNPIEVYYTIGVLLIITVLLGYLLTQILRILVHVYTYKQQRRVRTQQLFARLNKEKVRTNIVKDIKGQVERLQRQEKNRNRPIQRQMLKLMPEDAWYRISLVVYQEFFDALGFTFVPGVESRELVRPAQEKSIFLNHFISDIREKRYFIGDLLYRQGQRHLTQLNQDHWAYFYTKTVYADSVIVGMGKVPQLTDGKLQANARKNIGSFPLRRQRRLFGQVQFFNGMDRSHWAVCLDNCIIFQAPRHGLLDCYDMLSAQEKQILFLKTQKVEEQQCLICGDPHSYKKCSVAWLQTDEAIEHVEVDPTSPLLKKSRLRGRGLKRTVRNSHCWSFHTVNREIAQEVGRQAGLAEDSALSKIEQVLAEDYLMDNQRLYLKQTEEALQSFYKEHLKECGLGQEYISQSEYCNYRWYRPQGNINEVLRKYNSCKQKP